MWRVKSIYFTSPWKQEYSQQKQQTLDLNTQSPKFCPSCVLQKSSPARPIPPEPQAGFHAWIPALGVCVPENHCDYTQVFAWKNNMHGLRRVVCSATGLPHTQHVRGSCQCVPDDTKGGLSSSWPASAGGWPPLQSCKAILPLGRAGDAGLQISDITQPICWRLKTLPKGSDTQNQVPARPWLSSSSTPGKAAAQGQEQTRSVLSSRSTPHSSIPTWMSSTALDSLRFNLTLYLRYYYHLNWRKIGKYSSSWTARQY